LIAFQKVRGKIAPLQERLKVSFSAVVTHH